MAITVVAVYFFLLYDQTVSFKLTNNEENLGFKLSHYYAHCRDLYFNNFVSDFAIWLFLSAVSAAPIYFIISKSYELAIVSSSGMTDGIWSMGFTVGFSLICMHHGLVALYTKNWTWFLLATYIFSFLLFFPLCTVLLDHLHSGQYFKNGGVLHVFLHDTMSQPQFWLSMILTTAINLLLFYAYKAYYFLIRYPQFNEKNYNHI